MKNLINNIFLVTLVFFIPLFAEGKSSESKSFIQKIKEKITDEKEKIERKTEEKTEKKEQVKIEAKAKEKEKDNNKYKEKKEVKKPAEEESRIKAVKRKIVEEKKKEKEKNDYVYEPKNKHDYDRRYHSNTYRDYYYPDIYWTYDNNYYDAGYYGYTYVDEPELIYRRPIIENRHSGRIIFLNSSIETAYLGKDIDDTYGVTAKASANLYSLHFNCFYQSIFSSNESLTIYSVNGGYSFTAQNITLTPFIGAFYIEPLEEARLSYGANLEIFLPGNYNMDLYSINSSYGSLNFHNFSASLNYEFYRLNLGMGFNYNNYAGISFSGPAARLSFWL